MLNLHDGLASNAEWDTKSKKDTANQSNVDKNNQNITLVSQSSDR